MKIHFTACALAALLALTAACSGEDTPDDVVLHDPSDYFEPAPGATDEESQLRRDFQQKYGAFLLFNDTIQKRYNGTDVNGDTVYWVERLAMSYTIPQAAFATDNYTYDLLTTIEEKREALDFLENSVLPHITGRLMPYSWMLCKLISLDANSNHTSPYAVAGQRAVVVSTGTLSRLRTDAQRQQYIDRIMAAILGTLTAKNADYFSEFFEVSSGSYGVNFSAGSDDVAQRYVRTRGFLNRKNALWGAYATPSREEDLNDFATFLLQYDDDYIETAYADYPLVRKKWQLFSQVMDELGFRK